MTKYFFVRENFSFFHTMHHINQRIFCQNTVTSCSQWNLAIMLKKSVKSTYKVQNDSTLSCFHEIFSKWEEKDIRICIDFTKLFAFMFSLIFAFSRNFNQFHENYKKEIFFTWFDEIFHWNTVYFHYHFHEVLSQGFDGLFSLFFVLNFALLFIHHWPPGSCT